MINREIKFRAWHIGEEKMCEVNLLRPNNGAFLLGVMPSEDQQVGDRFLVIAPDDGRYCDLAEFQLMQFTGLLDKNGKEIYEGDLLRMRIYMANDGWNRHEVEIFSQGYAFWFKTLKYPGYTDCLWFHYNQSEREIIGNIYENPELIK